MSRLISRILLTILMLPLAAAVYFIMFFIVIERARSSGNWNYPEREIRAFVAGGAMTWAFVAIYWSMLWRKSVSWTKRRAWQTFAGAGAAVIAAGIIAVIFGIIADDDALAPSFVATCLAPALWLVATTFIWRETAAERAARIQSTGKGALTCPTCGYNLTGLTEARCPECGSKFTIDELLAQQPHMAGAELET
jgi:hypothetical protein